MGTEHLVGKPVEALVKEVARKGEDEGPPRRREGEGTNEHGPDSERRAHGGDGGRLDDYSM